MTTNEYRLFVYTAVTTNGHLISGHITASTAAVARATLERECGYYNIAIRLARQEG
jgi:hypothetical protein